MRAGAASETPCRRATISSRVVSLKSKATTAEASTTLTVTIFPDQPRCLVAALKTERGGLGGNFIHRQFQGYARRGLIDQRPQLPLERPMIGFSPGAELQHLLFRHGFDRQVHEHNPIQLRIGAEMELNCNLASL